MILRAAFWSLGAVLLLGMGHTSAEPTLAPKAPTAPEGVVACRPPAPSGDILQLTARLATAGKFGKLQPWQAHWYALALEKGLTSAGTKRVTFYGPFDGGTQWCTFWLPQIGRDCRCNRFTASTPPWVPRWSILWTGIGLRFCGDRGGAVKQHFDLWSERDLGDKYHALPYRFLRWGWAQTDNPSL